jgi:N-acyl-D-amino-acid deacylase
MLDIVIRNGLLVDGSGLPGFRGDLGIQGGRIVSAGRSLDGAAATQTIDAAGKVVAPGFIDPHTHVDAQVLFDRYAFPVIEHGVTTAVTGNCSLSMAPVRAAHRDRFSAMFRLIEEMPEAAFDSGVDWRWGEEFGGLVEQVERDVALNVAPLVGHSVLRMYVMGDDVRRAATDEEIARMCDVLRACLDAGAIGLSTSYVDVEDDLRPVPCRWSRHAELDAMSAVLGERNRMLQIVPEFFDPDITIARVESLGDLSRRHGIPTTFSPLFHNAAMPSAVERVLDAVDREFATGARVWPQVQTRPIDISWTLDQRSIMFLVIPGWWPVLSMTSKAAKLEALNDDATRQSLIDALDAVGNMPNSRLQAADFIVRETALDRNRDLAGRTLGDIAADRGTTPAATMLDLAREEDLGTWFVRANIGHVDDKGVGEMLTHDHVHIGASDAGAHVGSFSTYGDTGYLFGHFVRDCKTLSLESAVKKVTSDVAAIWGMADRGSLRPGMAADVVVFDSATIDRGPEIASQDFPGGGTRWIRRQVGVEHVVVNGVSTWSSADGYVDGARAGVVSTVATG